MHMEEDDYWNLAMKSLSIEQQTFIQQQMRRGKRTAWLNTMAEVKGIVLSPTDDELTIEKKIGGWILENFDDLGVRNGKCECGMSIRYVYKVVHVETRDSFTLGSSCIQTYTGLDAKTVNKVINKMKLIDLEKDEILKKLVNGWRLPIFIPKGLELPTDIKQHLELELPLLDRQLLRLKKLINKSQVEKQQIILPDVEKKTNKKTQEDIPKFDLFWGKSEIASTQETMITSGRRNKKGVPEIWNIPDSWIAVIHDKLNQLQSSGQLYITSRGMADYVAHAFGYEEDRYLTGKPQTYYLVARYMDHLDRLEVREGSLQDIVYRMK
ncbi:hypothetical protein C4A76_18205 [Brevibacillus laterosporus]|uniref:hypothetical protein n=1 Tax=Brevibacillus laterosporus TaxID=1465 RepID=UPI000CE53CE4|nr:hypothetical protein [Brevibacillus laterosporus]PPA84169.1 hypothetical protein C4A76_18205 [Brevibacillus laterosporus]